MLFTFGHSIFTLVKHHMKLLLLFFLSSFTSLISTAQVIGSDSRGKDVYSFYKSKSLSLPISAATATAKINYTKLLGKGTQYFVGTPAIVYAGGSYSHNDSLRLTMAKSTGLNFSFTAGNLLSNLAKVSTFHPTYTLGLGIGRNIDAFNNWSNIRSLKYPFYTWNINFFGSLDNVVLYDTIAKAQSRKKPFSKGVTAEGTLYLPQLSDNWLFSISGSITYENGSNISSLKNFQANSPTYSNSSIIALGDYVGKLGDLRNQNSFRFRASLPIFPSSMKLFRNSTSGRYRDSLQLCLIPYYSTYGAVNNKFNQLVGFYVNATQGQNLFTKNSTIVSGLGIGVDWTVNSDGLSNTGIFVAGSLDIHAIFDHERPKSQ